MEMQIKCKTCEWSLTGYDDPDIAPCQLSSCSNFDKWQPREEIHEGHPINHCIYFPKEKWNPPKRFDMSILREAWWKSLRDQYLPKEDKMETKCNIRDWKAWQPQLPTCPFCGGESELKSYKGSYWVRCSSYCPGIHHHDTPEAAIEAYGRRA